MGILKDNYSTYEKGDGTLPPEDLRTLHREAAVLASMTGSAELVDAIDDLYQQLLDTLVHVRRAYADKLEKNKEVRRAGDPWRPNADIEAASK